MLLSGWGVMPIAVLLLSVDSVVGDDLGQGYAEGLGNTLWNNKIKRRRLVIKHSRYKKKTVRYIFRQKALYHIRRPAVARLNFYAKWKCVKAGVHTYETLRLEKAASVFQNKTSEDILNLENH